MTKGAAHIFSVVLGTPNWAKSTKSTYLAGKLIVEMDISPPETAAELKAWNEEPFDFRVLTDAEFGVAQECFRHHASQGALIPSKHMTEALEMLKLTE